MKVRGFPPLLLSSLAARVATQMFAVLIVLFVLETRHSSALSGLVVLLSQIPGIIVSPIAGVLLDRGARVPLMVLDYVVAATCMGLIALLSLLHALPLWALLGIVSVASLTSPLSRVGGRSIFPILVPRSLWDRSNALDSGSFVVATVVGPTIAGVSVALIGPRWALAIPTSVMAAAALALLGVTVPAMARSTTGSSILADALGAVRYVWGNRVLRMLASTMTVFNFAGGSMVVAIPVLALHHLHAGSTTAGVLFAVMGLSGFLAGLTTGRLGTEGREKTILAMACGVTALACIVLAVGFSNEVVVVLAIAVMGSANGPLTVAMFSLRQRATEPEWFGRAFAVSMNLNFAGYPIGSAIAGLLLGHSVAAAFVVAASCALVGGISPAVLPQSHYEPVGSGTQPGPQAPLAESPASSA